jgi:hypothetical protein
MRTTCVHPYVCACARARVRECVRACESGGVRAAVGVVIAWLRACAGACGYVCAHRCACRVACKSPHRCVHVCVSESRVCPSVRPELRCIGPVPVGHGRRGARRPSPEMATSGPPHPTLVFACTSAPCVSSAATTAACPFQTAQWSGVLLRRNALAHRPKRQPPARVRWNVRAGGRARACVRVC